MSKTAASGRKHLVWGALVAIGAVALGIWIGDVVAGGLLAKYPVRIVGVFLGASASAYLFRRLSYERAVVLMVLTLPLLYGFVIDIGGFLRVTYLLTILAFALGQRARIMRLFSRDLSVQLLLVFIAYAILSTSFTLGGDFSLAPERGSGFRVTPFRSFVQAGQLLLMVAAFYVTLNYLTSVERLCRFANIVFWSTLVVTLYGFYDFAATLFGFPFISVITDTSYYAGGADSPTFSFGGIHLPRPRSTLGEPLDLSIFLFFGIAYSGVTVKLARTRMQGTLRGACVLAEVLLFLVANSRSSLIAAMIVIPLALGLMKRQRARLRALGVGVMVYVFIALAILPLAGGRGDLLGPASLFTARVESLTYLGASLGDDTVAKGQVGRNYEIPLRVFAEHPMFGVGLGNYPFHYARVEHTDVVLVADPFSLYLRLLTELGVAGTAMYLLFVGSVFWRVLRIARRSKDSPLRPFAAATAVALAGVMVARIGLSGFTTDSYVWVMFAVGVAVAHLVRVPEETWAGEEAMVSVPREGSA